MSETDQSIDQKQDTLIWEGIPDTRGLAGLDDGGPGPGPHLCSPLAGDPRISFRSAHPAGVQIRAMFDIKLKTGPASTN